MMMKTRSNIISTLLVILVHFLFHSNIVEGQSSDTQLKHLMRITNGLKSPLRIAIDSQDIVYVTDAFQGKICKYDTAGNFIGEFKTGDLPLAVEVTLDDMLYVSDRFSGKLQLMNSTGLVVKDISSSFKLPSYAAVDDENRLYIVDSKKKIVTIFNTSGDEIGSFGNEILSFPTGIAFDKKNQRILVVEHGGLNLHENISKMIHAFDKQGNWLTSFGEYGDQQSQFTRIQGIVVDLWGKIYIADSYQGVIMVLKENGELLTTIGQFGKAPGKLQAPMDLAIDSHRRIWVTSLNNSSLEVYDIRRILDEENTATNPSIPSQSELLQNYPNPFNPGTFIPFQLAKDNSVIICIYNEIGKLVRIFDLGKRQSGKYMAEGRAIYWDGNDNQGNSVASGIYFYEIRAGSYVAVRRMVLLK